VAQLKRWLAGRRGGHLRLVRGLNQ
jgi:hypothetical protein